jgi:MFS transporter, SET family, sugar efflux transporter
VAITGVSDTPADSAGQSTSSGTRPVLRRLFPLALVFLSVGLSMAMSSPFLTLFLSTALRVGPAQVTVFLIVAPLSAVLASTLIGRWSDGRVARRPVLIGAALAACLGATAMAVVRDYWVLLAVAATVIATGASLQPQLFAYAREAMQGSDRTSMAMSTLRTLFSVAWVAGPPLAAVILNAGGFGALYATAAGMYVVTAGLVFWRLRSPDPAPADPERPAPPADPRPDAPRSTIRLTVLGLVLLMCAANLGVQALPLFVSQDLHGNVREAGLILGLCAALEIPVMLGFGLLSTRVRVRTLLLVGAACCVTYYSLVTVSTSSWQLAAGQLVNAASIAAIAGLGVTYVQDMLPRHPGRASTLFVNAFLTGSILAGPILGTAQHLGFRFAYGAGAVLAAGGLLSLAASRPTRSST